MTLADLRCAQTITRKSLLSDPRVLLDVVHIQCIYEDVKPYFQAQELLSVGECIKVSLVGLVASLTCPVILG